MLAGLCSMEDAQRPGLSVEECVRRLKRFHYAFKRLSQIFTARITAEPIYELKMGFSLHAHLCAEQVTALRKRVSEMREPPLGMDLVPDANLEIFFDEILSAPATESLVAGLYEKAVPALKSVLEKHLEISNPLADQPSMRLCKIALMDLADISEFGKKASDILLDESARTREAKWLDHLDNLLVAAGNPDGTSAISETPLAPIHSATPDQ